MLRLDAVLVWEDHFRYNAQKAAIILVITCHLYMFMLLMLYFLVFTAVLMSWVKFGALYIHFGSCISKCFVYLQIIIYIYSN